MATVASLDKALKALTSRVEAVEALPARLAKSESNIAAIAEDVDAIRNDVAAIAGEIVDSPDPPIPPDPPTPPSDAVKFILGELTPIGTSPWPLFDEVQVAKALEHGNAYPGDYPYESQYYDQGLRQYVTEARTGSAEFHKLGDKINDVWYASDWIKLFDNSYISPRGSCMSGLMLRALFGRSDMWPGLTKLQRDHFQVWLDSRRDYPQLHEGIRDGAFALLHEAEMSVAHPDSSVRTEMLEKTHDIAVNYFCRLQKPDGGWYWPIAENGGQSTCQPFEVGMLCDALIAVHALTGDAKVAESIVRAVDFLWAKGYDQSVVTNVPSLRWRALRYFVTEGQTPPPYGDGTLYGIPDAKVNDMRQLNCQTPHAFGYAYKLTGDGKYKQQGDEIFASSYGRGRGPGADKNAAVFDYNQKNSNQAFRRGARYLKLRQ